ncbi:AAA family ATPase [Paenibacillus taiwanensis]|uniref:AAA family ATPase n=1 Tax=Paenibacillus taiwanensis TaxID=401638 RepID=UPI000418434A|nr:AAA family ATPase [Paenibacillus taiwanensis]
MKIDWLNITNIGGIRNLQLSFNPGLNLICGMNGVGKTTVLECIVNSFSHNLSGNVKRNSKSEYGEWEISLDGKILKPNVKKFSPLENEHLPYNFVMDCKSVIYIKEKRAIDYKKISITGDDILNEQSYSYQLIGGLTQDSIKTWFMNRISLIHEGHFSEAEIFNLAIAKGIFNLLDEDVKYSHLAHDSLDIMLETSRGNVYLEYLSSGFKSALFILLGIIKQIEFNFKEPNIKVTDFEGIIVIDEVDAHLHPRWQGVLVQVIKDTFKSAQIIATTHSPHMIQEAEADEIIALTLDESCNVTKLDLQKSEYGFKGWTIEEILEDIMGMKETRSNKYLETKKHFEEALEKGNILQARETYEVLLKMLHHRSPMRKIYELQLGTLGE